MKNKRRFLLALAFTIPTTFIFKGGETSYASIQLGEYNNATNTNDSLIVTKSTTDGKYVKLPRRTINQRGLDRNPVGETYTSKFNEADLPYEGHNSTVDETQFRAELKTLLQESKTKFLADGTTTYYAGSEKIYSKEGISKDAKAVDSSLSFPLDGFTYPLGLYAAPGEAVSLLIPVEFENELFKDDYENILSFVIGVTGRNYTDTGVIESYEDKRNTQTFPYRRTTFTSKEIFNKSNTITKDGKKYFEGKIASPLGGPIYVQSNLIMDYNIEIRATGALESRYYALDAMTDEENEDNFDNFTAPYFDIVAPSYRLSGEFRTENDVEPTNLANIAYIIQQRYNVTSYLDSTFPRQVIVVDRYRTGFNPDGQIGSAYVLIGKESFEFDSLKLLNKENYLLNEALNYSSRNHIVTGNYIPWGINNFTTDKYPIWSMSGIQGALVTNVASYRTDADNTFVSSMGQADSSHAYLTDPYSTIKVIEDQRLITNTASSYVNAYIYNSIFHSVGLGVMSKMDNWAWNASQWDGQALGGNDKRKITNGDVTLRALTYYSGFDFTEYMEKIIKANVSQDVKQEIKDKICTDTSTNCNYPKFAATGSLYTKSNERIRDLDQWRNDIESNVKKNGIPSYFSDEESTNSITYTADYKQPSEYVLKGGEATRAGIEKNVYKRNTTGANFRVSASNNTTLNLDLTLSNNKYKGRISSTAEISTVTLEWQESDAITDNKDGTYTVDPIKITSEDGTYNFALSIQYNDSTIPTEILYGTLEKEATTKQNDTVLRASPVLANTYYSSTSNVVDQQYNSSQMELISYGLYQKGHAIYGDDQDAKAFKDEYFDKYNKYDPKIDDNSKKILTDAERILSDGSYQTGTNTIPALEYEKMETSNGAVYYTYENKFGLNINEIILRDLQNRDAVLSDWKFSNGNQYLFGTIGDVSIYAGDSLDENGSPDLTKYNKVTTNINENTWDTADNGGIYNYYNRRVASNRIINLDKEINNKYIVVKIENGQTSSGGKDGSFKVAEIEFHSTKQLGDSFTDTYLENSNIKTFGNWTTKVDGSASKQQQFNGLKGDYLGFGFEGTTLAINANQFVGSGKIRINIDGQTYEVDTSSLVGFKDNTIFNIDLENKEHLVTIEVLEGNVELTSISFNSDKFIEVTEKQIKDQLGIKGDSNTDTDKPSEPEDPTGPDNPTTDITTNNKMTNIIIGSVGYSLLGIAVISLGAILIVEHKKNKQKVDQ